MDQGPGNKTKKELEAAMKDVQDIIGATEQSTREATAAVEALLAKKNKSSKSKKGPGVSLTRIPKAEIGETSINNAIETELQPIEKKDAEEAEVIITPPPQEQKVLPREKAPRKKPVHELPSSGETIITPAPQKNSLEAEKPEKETEQKTTERLPLAGPKEVKDFIAKFKLEDALNSEFINLSPERKLQVVERLQKRIVDLVKSNAETQYSKDLSSRGKLKALRATFSKARETKTLEAEIFAKIRDTEEGKQIILKDLDTLTQMASKTEVQIGKEGRPEIVFLAMPERGNVSYFEKAKLATEEFNAAANKFKNVPYEWGQERSGKNRDKYDEVKAEYESAKERAIRDRIHYTNADAKAKTMLDMFGIDSMVKMEQFLNTHPQIEKALQDFENEGKARDTAKGVWDKLASAFTGKNAAATAVGIGLRFAARGAAWATSISGITLVAAPVIGAAIGAWRGNINAKNTLEQRQKDARRGKKDESKEKRVTSDATKLTKKLEGIIQDIEQETDAKERSKKIALLGVRIEHTKGKIEKGEVSFGDAESSLANQFMLLEQLNQAIVLNAYHEKEKEVKLEFKNHIEGWLKKTSGYISETTTKAQQDFVKEKMKNAAILGAGFAVGGYLAKYAAEYFGWWGSLDESPVAEKPSPSSPFNQRFPGAGNPGVADAVKTIHPVSGEGSADTAKSILTQKIETAESIANPGETGSGTSALEATKASEAGEALAKATEKAGNAVSNEFTLKLGEGGVPKNLETVFNAIAANSMPKPEGAIDEAFATKSLNMAANLVKLTEGAPSVAGVTQAEWNAAGNFWNGELEIKDHKAFNEISTKLQARAEENWSSGKLQSEGAAISYIPNISQNTWLNTIVHADGLGKVGGVDTGIVGHDSVTEVNDFNKSEMVSKARTAVLEKMGEAESAPNSYADLPPKEMRGDMMNTTVEHIDPFTGKPAKLDPLQQLIVEKVSQPSEDGQNITFGQSNTQPFKAEAFDLTNDTRSDGYNTNFGPTQSNPYGRMMERGATVITQQMQDYADSVFLNNLNAVFPGNAEEAWDLVGPIPANKILGITEINAKEQNLTRMVSYLQRLQEVTGLEPKGRSLLNWTGETAEEYIIRAVKWANANGKIEDIKIKSQ